MGQRILRDWTLSEKMNSLSAEGERFFVRLIMQADDYGHFYSDERILKSRLFPLNENIRKTDIARWTAEVVASGVVRSYEAEGKKYLEIIDFNQRLRQKTSHFPQPADKCPPCADNSSLEVEVEEEGEVEGEENSARTHDIAREFPGYPSSVKEIIAIGKRNGFVVSPEIARNYLEDRLCKSWTKPKCYQKMPIVAIAGDLRQWVNREDNEYREKQRRQKIENLKDGRGLSHDPKDFGEADEI